MGQYKNFDDLWVQVGVLQVPQKYSQEQYQQAQQYCNDFTMHNIENLDEFFKMFAHFGSENTNESKMTQFWLLGAIVQII